MLNQPSGYGNANDANAAILNDKKKPIKNTKNTKT
uniref:Uncharacterized protein n=1 Tax=viral metagenome TaxID=1070528 RepID=A0A6C0I1F5_9ZZZZ